MTTQVPGSHTLFGLLTGIVVGHLLLNAPVAQAAPFAYITNQSPGKVSVIDIATNTVTANVTVGAGPRGVGVSPDGTRVYVGNNSSGSNSVSVISTASNTVI
ncbi:MAG: hypothetical protein ABI039_11375, partial [Vicinamibacterales bacterium]